MCKSLQLIQSYNCSVARIISHRKNLKFQTLLARPAADHELNRSISTTLAVRGSKDKTQQEEVIMKQSIKEAVNSNPDLFELNKAAQVPTDEATSHPPFQPTKFGKPSEYDGLHLTQEQILVDTFATVKTLVERGFTQEQAECVTYTLTNILTNAMREQRKVCVEKAALDLMREQVLSYLQALRQDITILEKSELSDLRNENEKLKLLLSQTRSNITEDVNKVKNQLTLDINMERSRAKDDNTMMEKGVASLTTKMTAEIGKLETTFERYKNDIYKFIGGSLFSALTIGFSAWRILKS